MFYQGIFVLRENSRYVVDMFIHVLLVKIQVRVRDIENPPSLASTDGSLWLLVGGHISRTFPWQVAESYLYDGFLMCGLWLLIEGSVSEATA